MSDPIEINKVKLNALTQFFTDLGYKTSSRIGQNEFRTFLNNKTSTGRFDSILSDKLFEVLNLDSMSTMSIEDFIYGFIQFEEDLRKNAESFNIKLAQEQEIYNKILKQCRAYQAEKLNAEGFCENAKIYGEITDIDIKQKLEGIKEIIIIVLYNEKKVELRFQIGDKTNSQLLKKTFSFKPTSRKDHFEFIMKGVNEKDEIFDIGSKVFPLDDIGSQEEYLVQIVIPEMGKPDQIVAYINTKIVLYMSDYKYYESLRRKQEKRLKKYITAANKATEYLKYVREIYGDLSLMKSELIVDFNNEKLMQRKGAKLNVNFNNELEAEAPGGNYFVEFNNEREVQTRAIPLRVEFNNSKEVLSPITQTQKYEYKYNVTSSVNQNVINELEKKIEILNKEKEDITKRLENIPKPNLEPEVNIKKTTDITIIKKQQTEIPKNINPPPEPTSPNTQISQKIQKTIKEVKTQNISKPQVTLASPEISQNKTTTTTETETQIKKSQNITTPQIITSSTSQNNNTGAGGYIQKTTETTKTITTTPIYAGEQNQNTILQSVNGQQSGEEFIKSFLSGQTNQYNIGNTTTTTTTTTYGQNNYNLSNLNVNGQYEGEGEIGYGTDSLGQVNEYQIGANETSNTQTLNPIINQTQYNSSYNNVIFNETTNKALVSENTLPVSYLPDKINELIVDDKVTTLPVITTGSSITHDAVQLQPIIHDVKTYYSGGESNINDINNINITNYNASSGGNIIGENYGADYTSGSNMIGNNYNFSSTENANYGGSFEANGISNINYNFNDASANNWVTTQTTETTTTQYNNYNVPMEGSDFTGSQQIQYGI